MEVREKKREIGELGNGMRDDTRTLPEIDIQRAPEQDLQQRIEISGKEHPPDRTSAAEQDPALCLGSLANHPPGELHAERSDDTRDESSERSHAELKGSFRENAAQLPQQGCQEEAVVVIVLYPVSEPRIVRGHPTAARGGVGIRQFHRLFAAQVRMPEIGVAPAQEQEEAESEPEGKFARHDCREASAPRDGPHGAPAEPPRERSDDRQRQEDRRKFEGEHAPAGQQPHRIGDHE
ncbi:hypothetical protein HRbin27_00155 [bacterium HR27]|nr:hypothetical protein HRbin27_00155 [bacterium HR27]